MRTQLIAVQSSLAWWGKMLGPASPSPSLFALLKKGGPVAVVGLWSPSPPYLVARRSSLTVHKSGAAYSWNYPESSTCNKLSDRFHPDYITLFSSNSLVLYSLLSFPSHLNSVSLSVSLSACHILNFLEIQTHPSTVRMKTKAAIIIRSSSLPSVRGGRERERL